MKTRNWKSLNHYYFLLSLEVDLRIVKYHVRINPFDKLDKFHAKKSEIEKYEFFVIVLQQKQCDE